MLYRALYDRLLVHVEPERAHHWAATAMAYRVPGAARRFAPEIAIEALGLCFASPLGVAAGLDKDATFFAGLGSLGFGAVEIGTVTPLGQPGNPKPRIRRVPADRALVNAMGFPNDGGEVIAARLAGRAASARSPGVPVLGANLGKNRDTPLERAADDYVAVAQRLAPLADYLVLNVSSPNTPGLRSLESVSALAPIVEAVSPHTAGRPLLVKISPDLADADVEAVAELVISHGLAGVIATNTTVDREVLSLPGRASVASFRGGGVSGAPLRRRSLEVLSRLHAVLKGSGAIAVSVGGVQSGADVWERILAGATLVQAYTAFIYEGPGWPRRVNAELAARVRAAGADSIADLVGTAA